MPEVAAHREGRVDARLTQRHGQQRGGRGLAVGAGDRERTLVEQHRLQRSRTRPDAQAALARR
ncbi:MAG: hypothetical protein CME15_14170, partial [Gemmatimonadetes bacterium]|nr:hypothetical protein [Gemmatimonadota bacterium]